MKRTVVVFFLILLLTEYVYSEIVVGGEGIVSVPLMINPAVFPDTEITFNSILYPNLAVYNDSYELYGKGEIYFSFDHLKTSFNILELYINIFPMDELFVKIGRFPYLPGTAEFFSNTNFFGSTNFEKLISGNLRSAAAYSDLIQSGLFFGNHYAVLTLELFPHYAQIPDTGSPWFPMKGIPEVLYNVPFSTGGESRLNSVTVDENIADPSPGEVSFSIETGTSFGMVDLSLFYYHGSDKSLLYQGNIEFINSHDNFDVYLGRIKRRVDIFGFSSAVSAGSFRFWADSSFLNRKVFATDTLLIALNNISIILAEKPALSATSGLSWEYYGMRFNFLLLAEYYHLFIYSDNTSLVLPLFSNTFSTMGRLTFPGIKTDLSILMLYSTADKSLFLNPSVVFSPSDELEFLVSVPIFGGDRDTNFGQFGSNHLVTASLTWRY